MAKLTKRQMIANAVLANAEILKANANKKYLFDFSKTLDVTAQSWKAYVSELAKIGIDWAILENAPATQQSKFTQIGGIAKKLDWNSWKGMRAYLPKSLYHRDYQDVHIHCDNNVTEYDSYEEMLDALDGDLFDNCKLVVRIDWSRYPNRSAAIARTKQVKHKFMQEIWEAGLGCEPCEDWNDVIL